MTLKAGDPGGLQSSSNETGQHGQSRAIVEEVKKIVQRTTFGDGKRR